MIRNHRQRIAGAALLSLALSVAPFAAPLAADERQSLEELRNTVINLLQALVDQGVISKEKAAQMVKQAQDKAAADAAALAKSEEGAVRVPYVPQVVQDQIAKQVAEEVKPAVVADVVKEAKDEQWGVPGALPDWIRDTRISGNFLLREEALLFGRDNVPNAYLNYNAVNAAGGRSAAGTSAFLNTTDDRIRLRGSARLAFDTSLTDSLTAGVRLATGNSTDLVSPTQTLDGTAPFAFGLDNLFVRLDERDSQRFNYLTLVAGRFDNPWFAPSDLIFHKYLTFNGIAGTGRFSLGGQGADKSHIFLTLAAMPEQDESALSSVPSKNKTLFAGQLGANLLFNNGQRFVVAAAFFDFMDVQGEMNPPFSTVNNWTAPLFFRSGNTVFDISNDNNPASNYFALASKFRLINLNATYIVPVNQYTFQITADAVDNVGFNQQEILARTGLNVTPRTKGYQGEVSFGTPDVLRAGAWRALVGYRYLQRDAVIDGLTDSDFHYFGGTDAAGYYLVGDYGIAKRVWLRFRYLSANSIDGPTYDVDTVQLDLRTRF
jgi:hypothetical protein